MKAYCINCGSSQPSKFRPGQDAITNESYEDLCCDTCHFIVATIQDRESSQQPSQALEPVYFSQFSGCGLEEVSKDRYDEIAEDDRITYYTAAGASPQQSPLLQFCTCEDCKPMECEGCRINRERRELLPAPSEAAREYMNGYSDCKERAGATSQAQPESSLLIGEMRESGVVWFNQNPHAWPLGTTYYAVAAPQPKETK